MVAIITTVLRVALILLSLSKIMASMEKWITVITFVLPHEAYVAETLLRSSGITVSVRDEYIIGACHFYSNAVGGVKLQVPGIEYEEALTILAEGGYIKTYEAIESSVTFGNRCEYFPRRYMNECPYCGSENVAENRLPGLGFALAILLNLGFLLPFFNRKYLSCFDCNKEWKIRRFSGSTP